MKNHKLFIMLLLVSEMVFSYCTSQDGGPEDHSIPGIVKNDRNDHVHEYTITVSSKNWQVVNSTERFVDIPIKEITENILKEGQVMVYLIEGAKHLALPFNYYQVRRILSFQPSFEPGHAYISIYGNFIMNVSAKYEFKLLIISKDIVKERKKEKK